MGLLGSRARKGNPQEIRKGDLPNSWSCNWNYLSSVEKLAGFLSIVVNYGLNYGILSGRYPVYWEMIDDG